VTEMKVLLQDYEDIFPTSFIELKGIKGYLGEMKIDIKPDSKLVKHRPYHLNPRVKEKVKKAIDRMVAAGMIFPFDKVEGINPITIQRKKGMENIPDCMDYMILNASYVQDPFLKPSSDEVPDHITTNEEYSFTYGFFGYHQDRISKEDKKKTTFTTECGSFSYNFMPFGLKNSPSMFSWIVIEALCDFIHKFIEVYLDDWIVYR